MRASTPRPVFAVGALLGEGPVWIGREQALWFVDIKRSTIHRYTPGSGDHQSWRAPAFVGWILPSRDEAFIVGLQTGLHRFTPSANAFELIHAPEPHLPKNRLNDATVDSEGRIWFGSMDNDQIEPSGRLYRFCEGQCTDVGMPEAIVTNGPAISPDGNRLYHVDTSGRTVWIAQIADGGVGRARVFATIEDVAGYPDGAVCDSEGCVWIGLFGGWGVRRYDPDGRLMQTVRFPVANVTKIAFGGPSLDIAYATTARIGLDDAALTQQPHAGDLFAFEPGVKGLPVATCRV